MSTFEHTSHTQAPPQPLSSIDTAIELLEAARGLALLRQAIPSENATTDLSKLLTLARVAVADAITTLEEE